MKYIDLIDLLINVTRISFSFFFFYRGIDLKWFPNLFCPRSSLWFYPGQSSFTQNLKLRPATDQNNRSPVNPGHRANCSRKSDFHSSSVVLQSSKEEFGVSEKYRGEILRLTLCSVIDSAATDTRKFDEWTANRWKPSHGNWSLSEFV